MCDGGRVGFGAHRSHLSDPLPRQEFLLIISFASGLIVVSFALSWPAGFTFAAVDDDLVFWSKSV